jgi:hypothetical protein
VSADASTGADAVGKAGSALAIREEAIAVLRTLAEGFDPRTGEELPPGGLWSDPNVLRALFLAVQAMQAPPQEIHAAPPPASRRNLPENAGKAWTAAEDAQLEAEFETERSAKALAAIHGRTAGSMTSRLVRLGLITRETSVGRNSPESNSTGSSNPGSSSPNGPKRDGAA